MGGASPDLVLPVSVSDAVFSRVYIRVCACGCDAVQLCTPHSEENVILPFLTQFLLNDYNLGFRYYVCPSEASLTHKEHTV